jgi:uncharacterized protein YlxW (UPF0749 family)
MAETWKKVTVDGQEVIEVTRTDATICNDRRLADEIRELEHEIADCDVRKAAAGARLAVKRQQLAALPVAGQGKVEP